MAIDSISSIEVDAEGAVWVYPCSAEFPYIYREAMEVHWCSTRQALHSPVPREWSVAQWLQQIQRAALQHGIELQITASTKLIGTTRQELCLPPQAAI
jgi:hypothetical protein